MIDWIHGQSVDPELSEYDNLAVMYVSYIAGQARGEVGEGVGVEEGAGPP